MGGVAVKFRFCQDASVPIPLRHFSSERDVMGSACVGGGVTRVGKVGIQWKHASRRRHSPLFVGNVKMVIEIRDGG